jgi:hypothetical protein
VREGVQIRHRQKLVGAAHPLVIFQVLRASSSASS